MITQDIIHVLADGLMIPVVLIGGYALVWKIPKGQRFEAYCRIVMAGLTAYLVAQLLAAVYQPVGERPFQILGVAPGASYLKNAGFPSDHALFCAFMALAVWFETRQRLLTIILVILAILVGVGRVLALVHTPLDILGGFVVACVGAIWYLQASPRKLQQPVAKKAKI